MSKSRFVAIGGMISLLLLVLWPCMAVRAELRLE